jgi:hypothetical protein
VTEERTESDAQDVAPVQVGAIVTIGGDSALLPPAAATGQMTPRVVVRSSESLAAPPTRIDNIVGGMLSPPLTVLP